MIWYHLEKKKIKTETGDSGTNSLAKTLQQQENNKGGVDCLAIDTKPEERSDVRDIVRKQEMMRLLDLDNFSDVVRTTPKEISAAFWWKEELSRKSDTDDQEQMEDSDLAEDNRVESLCKRIEDLLEDSGNTAKK